LDLSKKRLEDILGKKVSFLSFPGGRYNKDVINCAIENKYLALYTSEPFAFKRYGNTYIIGRYTMKQPAPVMRNLQRIINMNIQTRVLAKASYYGKYYLKKSLGNKIYYRYWKQFIHKSNLE
jgi:hypothetical protein